MNPAAVLLNVDDFESVRYARSRILAAAGFRVHEASNGAETLELAEKHQPDLVLLDVHLPDFNGIEVCRRLKQQRDTSPIVLQISASALSPSHAKESLDAGADAYLMEPVDPDVLVSTVRALLRLHHAEQSLQHANRQLEIVNKELRRSNEDLQQFAFAESHDLQDPLRTISIFTELIHREMGGDLSERQEHYFKRVASGITQMSTLIRNLLAYSQVGREGHSLTTVEIDGVVSAALANLADQIKQEGCKVEIPHALPRVFGDFTSFVSLFQNLLSNSLKYRDPDRALVVRIEAEQSSAVEWVIRVTDNGIGIPKEYHQQIFEPFKRLHGSEIAGNGIGLALCQRIVEVGGGRMWVESTPGEGTTLCFTLRAA